MRQVVVILGLSLALVLVAGSAQAQEFIGGFYSDDISDQLPGVLAGFDPVDDELTTPSEFASCPSDPVNTVSGVGFSSGLAYDSQTAYGLEWEDGSGPNIFLYELSFDPCPVGTRRAAPVGFTNLESLVYDPRRGRFLSASFDFSSHLGDIVTIDKVTGVGQPLGAPLPPDVRFVGMTYDRRADLVYAATSAFGGLDTELYTIDPETGSLSLIGNVGLPASSFESLFIDLGQTGTELIAGGATWFDIDAATGAGSPRGGDHDTVWGGEQWTREFIAIDGPGLDFDDPLAWQDDGGLPRSFDAVAIRGQSQVLWSRPDDTDVDLHELEISGGSLAIDGQATLSGALFIEGVGTDPGEIEASPSLSVSEVFTGYSQGTGTTRIGGSLVVRGDAPGVVSLLDGHIEIEDLGDITILGQLIADGGDSVDCNGGSASMEVEATGALSLRPGAQVNVDINSRGTIRLDIDGTGAIPDAREQISVSEMRCEGAGHELIAEFGGATLARHAAPTVFAPLVVAGTLTADGTLRVELVGAEQLTPGEFTFITATTIEGEFDAIEAPDGIDVVVNGNEIRAIVSDGVGGDPGDDGGCGCHTTGDGDGGGATSFGALLLACAFALRPRARTRVSPAKSPGPLGS